MKIILQNLSEIPNQEYTVKAHEELTVVVYANTAAEGSVHVRLAGTKAVANIYGIFVNSGNNSLKLHTLQHHDAYDTTSNLLVKSVLMDAASFSYDGAIRVEKTGQKTDAYQRNENLLLSEHTNAQSKPSLEILADDVRCTHGATIGNIDREQLFYLASRGISGANGKTLMVEGFLESVLEKIPDTIQANKVRKSLWQNLSKQLQ